MKRRLHWPEKSSYADDSLQALAPVVLMTYNRPHLIIHALQSVVDCDLVNEILVVDDFTGRSAADLL